MRHSAGFTLIELIVTIILLATLSIGTTTFIRFGVDIYQDNSGRSNQISESRFITERLTRELREAVPNSVRVDTSGQCVEFLPILASSTYVDVPVLPEQASADITVVAPSVIPTQANQKLIVYPTKVSDVYVDGQDVTGKTFSIESLSAPANDLITITLANAVRFRKDSPIDRYFIAGTPISYCQSTDNKIYRYENYAITAAQQVPSAATGVLMAQNQVNPQPFAALGATQKRNSVVKVNFEFTYNDESLDLYNEVHIVNVP